MVLILANKIAEIWEIIFWKLVFTKTDDAAFNLAQKYEAKGKIVMEKHYNLRIS